MKQYIDKSAVVEEIERIKKEECPTDTYEGRCKMLWFEQFSSFLDTLETKEVDLEKEIKSWLDHGHITDTRYDDYDDDDIERTAKHFFELGLKSKVNKRQL